MKHFKSLVLAAFAAVLTVTSLSPALPAYADSSALSITPKKNYLIEPGKSVDDTLTIRNMDSLSELNLSLRVVDFSYTDETGTPKLYLDQNAPQTTWSLKDNISLPKEVTIPAGESKTLDMKVAIPAGQGAGSYYSAIVYSSSSGSGGNVGLSASGVTLVFVNVPGKVSEDLTIQKLGAYEKASTAGVAKYVFMSTGEPQNLAYTLVNKGNVAESPVGSLTLKDMWGHNYKIASVNPAGSLALRGQTRTFTTCIKTKGQSVDFNGKKTETTDCTSPGLWPGLYTVTADLFYGQNGNNTNEITKTAYFWYLPWWFIIVSIVVIALAAYFIWKFVRFVRRKLNLDTKKRKK